MHPEPHNRLPDPNLYWRGALVQVAGRVFQLRADATGKRWWQDITKPLWRQPMGLKLQLHVGDQILVDNANLARVIATGNSLVLDVASPLEGISGHHNLTVGRLIYLHPKCTMRVLTLERTCQVEFDAPRELPILRIPADMSKWHANAKRRAAGMRPSGSPKFN